MNIDKMINMLLIKLSKEYDIFYMEKRTYKEGKIYKSYIVDVGGIKRECKNKKDLLLFLSEY